MTEELYSGTKYQACTEMKLAQAIQIIKDLLNRSVSLMHSDPLAVKALNLINENPISLPDEFIKKGLVLAEGSTLFGKKITDMNREELIASVAQGWSKSH